MRISVIIIGVLIMGFVVGGYYSIINGLANGEGGYNIDVDDHYQESFDETELIGENITNSYNKMLGFSENKAAQYLTMVPDALILVKNLISLPVSIVGGMIGGIVEYLGLPSWVASFLLVIVIVLVVFGFIALILRYKHT